jgi:hypothetical protein
LGIGDWGLGIGDWGLGPIPNPHIIKLKMTLFLNKFNLKYFKSYHTDSVND